MTLKPYRINVLEITFPNPNRIQIGKSTIAVRLSPGSRGIRRRSADENDEAVEGNGRERSAC